MSAVIYVLGTSFVAAMLFAAINNVEPNRRYALVLKFLIVRRERVAREPHAAYPDRAKVSPC
jgi:hypothetical protein